MQYKPTAPFLLLLTNSETPPRGAETSDQISTTGNSDPRRLLIIIFVFTVSESAGFQLDLRLNTLSVARRILGSKPTDSTSWECEESQACIYSHLLRSAHSKPLCASFFLLWHVPEPTDILVHTMNTVIILVLGLFARNRISKKVSNWSCAGRANVRHSVGVPRFLFRLVDS